MSMHIQAKEGEIAEKILLPGDPLRAKYIRERYLEGAVCFNEIRGMYGYTGTYKGQRMSVMATGMGVPSISIYAQELMAEYGCRVLIRTGTAGSYSREVHVGDLVISTGTCYTTSIMDYAHLPGTYAPVADYELVHTATELAKKMGISAKTGLTVCNDLLYFDNKTRIAKQWNEYGVLASEMEGAALYILAAKHRAKALTIMNVSNSFAIPEEEPLSRERREKELDDLITLGLETLLATEI